MTPTTKTTTTTTATPQWTCKVCQKPVTRDGYLVAYYGEIDEYEGAKEAWEDRHRDKDGFVIQDMRRDIPDRDDQPRRAVWHTLHIECDPSPDRSDCYWIEVERIDTWLKVAGWTTHLHGKRWIASTNWGSTIGRAGAYGSI